MLCYFPPHNIKRNANIAATHLTRRLPHNLDGWIEWRSIVTFVGWSVHQRTGEQTVDTHGVLRGQPESTTSEQHDWREVRIETPVGDCIVQAYFSSSFVRRLPIMLCYFRPHNIKRNANIAATHLTRRLPLQPRRGDKVAEYSDVCRLCMCIALTGLLFVFLCSAVTDHALLLSAATHLTRRLPPQPRRWDRVAEYSDVCRHGRLFGRAEIKGCQCSESRYSGELNNR